MSFVEESIRRSIVHSQERWSLNIEDLDAFGLPGDDSGNLSIYIRDDWVPLSSSYLNGGDLDGVNWDHVADALFKSYKTAVSVPVRTEFEWLVHEAREIRDSEIEKANKKYQIAAFAALKSATSNYKNEHQENTVTRVHAGRAGSQISHAQEPEEGAQRA